MAAAGRGTIVVTGATGLQGRAVTRHLLQDGWHVRGLTRDAASARARALAALGAEVVRADMGEGTSLRPAFAGADGVYSVQNPFIGGPEAEVRQGTNVADAAKEAGVRHLVYGSAGTGQAGTGIPSWETKLRVEAHMRALGLPLTVLRPMAFMELMTDKKFFPVVSCRGYHAHPRSGSGTPRRKMREVNLGRGRSPRQDEQSSHDRRSAPTRRAADAPADPPGRSVGRHGVQEPHLLCRGCTMPCPRVYRRVPQRYATRKRRRNGKSTVPSRCGV